MSKLEEAYKKDYDQKLSDAKKQMLEKILNLRPELIKNKQELYNDIFDENNVNNVKDVHEIVLDVIQQNNKIYYIDKNTKRILNSDVKQVGIYNKNELVLFKDNETEISDLIKSLEI